MRGTTRDWSWSSRPPRPLPSLGEIRVLPRMVFDTIDSTSAQARRMIESLGGRLDGPRLLVAQTQTGGVGRFGRPWASPRGGLWCTLVWPVPEGEDAAAVVSGLGIRVGVALWETVVQAVQRRWAESAVRIKWPNDILIDGRKVAGVLTEVLRRDGRTFILVGVGINANLAAADLPPDVAPTSTTIRDELGTEVDVGRLETDLVRRLHRALSGQGLDFISLMTARRQLHGIGQPARITLPDGNMIAGAIVGLTDDGTPVLRTEKGQVVLPPGCDIVQS
jgi:BirA family biotin operon repressor/biotin-[acetyl-CoA-carboxylase] ligase